MVLSSCFLHKKTADDYIVSAKKYSDKKDYSRALRSYSKAIELNSYLYETYFDRASIEILIGDSLNKERAIDDLGVYINANEADPKDKESLSKAYFKRADMMIKLGYKSDACDDWRKARDLNQSNYSSVCEQIRLKCK